MTTQTKRVPLVLPGQALRSLRDAGYSLPAALGELPDNAIEANANQITIEFFEDTNKKGKKHITQIACADDGDGMGEELAHYLQLGFSTRYMRRDTIGRYGVGAKMAALNFCQRIDVWSRKSEAEPWWHVHLDIEEIEKQQEENEEVGIELPDTQPVPEQLQHLLSERSGTLVVWSKIDRLEEGRLARDANALRVEVEKELSRMFRTFLEGGIEIRVGTRKLLPHDPLFLMERTWADNVLAKETKRRGDEAKGGGHYPATIIVSEVPIRVANSEAKLTVTLYPREAIRPRHRGGDELAKKLRIPENQGAISFMRRGREINYTNVPRIFPRAVEDPDRYIGIQVDFEPELDEFFGVRHVKRGVEPHDELRAKLKEALVQPVTQARRMLEEIWGEKARESRTHTGEHGPIVEAAAAVNKALPKSRAKGPEDPSEVDRVYEDLAKDVGKTEEEEKKEYIDRAREQPFVVESVDFPGQVFIDIQHVDEKVVIRLNTRHRFYREMWEPIRSIAERLPGSVSGDEAVRTARRTIEALTLMVIAYGKAESLDDNPHERYMELRNYWGQFLDSMMGKVKGVL